MLFRNLLLATTAIAACAICLPCRASPIPANEVTVFVGNNQGMPDPAGVAMFATFTPPGGLMAAAEALDYIGFDWQQTITNWPNPDLHKFGGALLTPVPNPNPPYLDPPLGGYNYNPCGGKAPGASAAAAYPFYFAPTGPSSNCWSLAANETSNTLSFADEPMDHELAAAEIAAGNIPKFTTELVGILPGYIPGPELFEWTWDTTYNGTVASASILVSTSANSPYLNPGFGGTPGSHATILTINGVPVPEPPALLLLASGVLAMLAARKAAGWNGPRHRPG
jgi:hypothetical protein